MEYKYELVYAQLRNTTDLRQYASELHKAAEKFPVTNRVERVCKT